MTKLIKLRFKNNFDFEIPDFREIFENIKTIENKSFKKELAVESKTEDIRIELSLNWDDLIYDRKGL